MKNAWLWVPLLAVFLAIARAILLPKSQAPANPPYPTEQAKPLTLYIDQFGAITTKKFPRRKIYKVTEYK